MRRRRPYRLAVWYTWSRHDRVHASYSTAGRAIAAGLRLLRDSPESGNDAVVRASVWRTGATDDLWRGARPGWERGGWGWAASVPVEVIEPEVPA